MDAAFARLAIELRALGYVQTGVDER